MRKVLLLLCLFVQSCFIFSKVSVGEWRTHFSYNSANEVVYADGKIYVEASNKLYSYDSKTGEKETFSTLTGLNGHNITSIAWCEAESTLILVYSDGNIDFLTKSGLVNLSDFKNKSLTGDKTIHGIRIEGSKAYLSTGIGLMVIDVSKREISDTYYLKLTSIYTNIDDAAVWNDTVTVATASGLYWGNTNSNLLDASSWYQMPFVSGTNAVKMVRFNDELIALAENGMLYRKGPSGWTGFLNVPNTSKLKVQNGYLFVCSGAETFMFNSSFQSQHVETVESNDIAMNPTSDTLYIASGTKGLTKLSKTDSGYTISEDSIMANGPASNVAWKGFFKDGAFYTTAGAQAQNWGNRAFNKGDILVFKDEKWSHMKNQQDIINETHVPFWDLLTLAIDPNDDKHYFITSWGEGLYEFRDSTFYKLYTNKNSPLVSSWPGDSSRYIRVDGATFDANGNLWVLSSNSENRTLALNKPLQILEKEDKDGKYYATWCKTDYPLMPLASTWNSILFTQGNQVWMNSMREPAGIFVLDNNNTIDTGSDDKSRWITAFTDQDGNEITPYFINCITKDLSGSVWIGTVFGPIVASNPANIFGDNYTFTRIKIPRNDGTDNADYLLNDIRINCITVDGANRKWIGTNGNGLYLLSPDGLKTIHQFNTDNSPLPSDYIWSITIDPETGEVFIGTESGLVSYRSDATQGADSYGNIHVFPNPVRPEYNGVITVTGLMENSQVKISDLAGNVLISGTSLGGQFTWSGYTKQGKRAASGVYLVFCASEDGSEYQTCKFMIVN